MKNSSDAIGNQTCDLPACSAVPQPTVPLRVGDVCVCVYIYIYISIKYCILTHNLHTFSKPAYISCHLCLLMKDISKRILSRCLDRIGVGTKSRHGGEHTCISYGAS